MSRMLANESYPIYLFTGQVDMISGALVSSKPQLYVGINASLHDSVIAQVKP